MDGLIVVERWWVFSLPRHLLSTYSIHQPRGLLVFPVGCNGFAGKETCS